jgi:hypothetical protein
MHLLKRRSPHEKLERLLIQAARFDEGRSDPTIRNMAEIAAELDAKSYAGGWVNLLNWQDLNTAPAAVNTFTTTTCIASPTPRAFIPANSLALGTRLRMRSWGSLSSVAGTATTTIGAALNGTGGTVICVSAAQTPATTTVFTWWAEFEFTVMAVGASPTIIGGGNALGLNATPTTVIIIPASAPAAVAFVQTQANSITPNATWSASSASNTYTTYGYTVEQLN